MRCGFSYWGLCQDFKSHRFSTVDTPDGNRYGRPIFVNELLRRGHSVIALQRRREEQPLTCQSAGSSMSYALNDAFDLSRAHEQHLAEKDVFPDVDVVFLEWRWPTVKNDASHPQHVASRYEPDLDRQIDVIEHYKDRCPIIAWDTDLKITPDDEKRWPELILSDPSFETNRQTRNRVSLPFWTDWSELLPVVEPYSLLGFIGNNYERPDEFKRFYFGCAENARQTGIQVSMYGNWLQSSSERESPEFLIKEHPNVSFNHRMNFFDSMQMMNRFICTTHVSKPRYYETGFMSPRYLEALAVGCPGLVPKKFARNNILGDEWVVDSGVDVIEKVNALKRLSLSERADVIASQRDACRRFNGYDVKTIISFIESCAGHRA